MVAALGETLLALPVVAFGAAADAAAGARHSSAAASGSTNRVALIVSFLVTRGYARRLGRHAACTQVTLIQSQGRGAGATGLGSRSCRGSIPTRPSERCSALLWATRSAPL